MMRALKRTLRRLTHPDENGLDEFLRDAVGVIHVGAHRGQERTLYARYGLKVLWVEPLPELFEALVRNIASFPEQRALRYLVTDEDGREYAFHVSSNDGASSSILELGLHREVWPDVTYTRTVTMRSMTLPALLQREGIEPSDYDVLVLDTQGSELLVLKGASSMLGRFKYVQTEVADFEAYKGCCQLAELEAYLGGHGFVEHARRTIARHADGSGYYDIVYRNRSAATS